MARKKTFPEVVTAAPPEPQAAVPEVLAKAKVVDMPVRDLLQLLGRTLPEGAPVPPSATTISVPTGIDEAAKVSNLTLRELLQLLGPSQAS